MIVLFRIKASVEVLNIKCQIFCCNRLFVFRCAVVIYRVRSLIFWIINFTAFENFCLQRVMVSCDKIVSVWAYWRIFLIKEEVHVDDWTKWVGSLIGYLLCIEVFAVHGRNGAYCSISHDSSEHDSIGAIYLTLRDRFINLAALQL